MTVLKPNEWWESEDVGIIDLLETLDELRAIVKDWAETDPKEDEQPFCHLCGGNIIAGQPSEHKPGCPWLRSQPWK